MKKIISLIMAVLMLCALCVPASAEDAKEVEPTTDGNGNYVIDLGSPGNYIIKKDCEVYKLSVYGTLTIAEDVKVKVTGFLGSSKCVLNIESGAVLEYSGDDFTNNGTMNVYGTVNDDSTQFTNSGTMNVYGTVNISNSRNRINLFGGTINVQGTLTSGGSATFSNYGIINKYCSGTFNGNNKNFLKGIMNTGVHDWKDGECTLCHTKCTHESWTGNVCDTCKFVCQHSEGTTVICNCCGGVVSTTAAGSTLSEGNLAIIVGVACSVVFLAVGFFIGKKNKKPALAGGESKYEE